MKYRWLYFLISALVLIPGIFSLVRFGLKPAIDFTGGTLWELKFSQKNLNEAKQTVKQTFEANQYSYSQIQTTDQDTIIVKTSPMTPEEKTKLSANWEEFEEVKFETVGPTLGKELIIKTVVAVFLAALSIMAYVAWRFRDLMYGACAILAMFHDTFILIGSFSLLGHFYGVEIDTLFVTAVLTILSFSVHDTVVVYDRIRELTDRHPKTDFKKLVNQAVTETLSRSVNNSLTIIFMLLALFLLGGETIGWFVLALLIGTIAGTFSSTFTAAPLLIVWQNLFVNK